MTGQKNRLFLTLTLGLLLSVLLNLFLYREVRRWYRLFNLTRLNPLGLGTFDGTPTPADRPLVVIYGDSRAYGWPAPDIDGATFANRGIDGHTSQQCLLRFAAHVAPLAPDLLIIQVGINDLVAIGMQPQDADKIAGETANNIAALVAEAREQEMIVLLTTVFPPARVPLARRPFWSPEIEAAVVQVNELLRNLEGEGVLLFDTAPLLTGSDGYVLPRYARDELHLDKAGYEALNAALRPLLQQTLDNLGASTSPEDAS